MKKSIFCQKKNIIEVTKNFTNSVDKKTLVFDLDETLIHCNENA